jgi:hypothetical protein
VIHTRLIRRVLDLERFEIRGDPLEALAVAAEQPMAATVAIPSHRLDVFPPKEPNPGILSLRTVTLGIDEPSFAGSALGAETEPDSRLGMLPPEVIEVPLEDFVIERLGPPILAERFLAGCGTGFTRKAARVDHHRPETTFKKPVGSLANSFRAIV